LSVGVNGLPVIRLMNDNTRMYRDLEAGTI